MIGNYFEVSIDWDKGSYTFSNINEKINTKDSLQTLIKLLSIFQSNLTFVGQPILHEGLLLRDIVVIIKAKIDGMTHFPLSTEKKLMINLRNKIYEFVVREIGIRSIELSVINKFLDFLPLADAARLMITCKDFQKTLQTDFLKKYQLQKEAFYEERCRLEKEKKKKCEEWEIRLMERRIQTYRII